MSDAVSTSPQAATESADVIVVGAGPGGSTMAAYLAQAGLDVLLLEKTRFPREKVCGDGLTPRAVKEIDALGIGHGRRQSPRQVTRAGLVRAVEKVQPDVRAQLGQLAVLTLHGCGWARA